MRVVRAHLHPWRAGLVTPLRTAHDVFQVREGFSLQLEDGSGNIGRGEAVPLPAFGTEGLSDCQAALRIFCATIEGAKWTAELPALPALLSPLLWNTPAARHAAELALLELCAKEVRLPLRKLLDPQAREVCEVSALLTGSDRSEVHRLRAHGFRTLKLKVAAKALSDDVSQVASIRSEAGAAMALRIDANGGWRSAPVARSALAALAPFDLQLCEQPVAAHDVKGLIEVAGASAIPIAADEALGAETQREEMLVQRAPRVFVLKPMVLGGVLPALALARRAHHAGIASFVTSSLDGRVSRAACAQLAAALPGGEFASGIATGRLLMGSEAEEPFEMRDGAWMLTEAAGLGFER